MAKPFLTLTGKELSSGLALSAHAIKGGIWYKADGITTLPEPGTSQSTNNGLLMPSTEATTVGGTLTGSILAGTPDIGVSVSSGGAFFATDDNKLWSLTLDPAFGTSLASIRTIGGGQILTQGLKCFTDSSSNKWLLYRQAGQLGKYDGSSFTDNFQALDSDYYGAMHQFQSVVLLGNGLSKLARVNANMSVDLSALALPNGYQVSAISDDGTYPIIAITRNTTADPTLLTDTRILFWDGANTTGWFRDFVITDPFIYAMRKTPIGTFAFGVTGVWQITVNGVKKLELPPPGVYTASGSSTPHRGQAVSFFSDALIWGGSSGSNKAIKSFGKLDESFPTAYLHPFLGTAGKNLTYLDAQLLKGWAFVGDDTPQLKAYPFAVSGSAQAGNTAQTIYFNIPPTLIKKIRITFGEPLASGDSLAAAVYTDQQTASVSFGTVSYSASIPRRSKTLTVSNGVKALDQFSLLLTPSGRPKIKKIELFGDDWERAND